MTIGPAGDTVGVPARSIHRYAKAHPPFRVALDKALADGERARIAADGSDSADHDSSPASTATPDNFGEPAPHTVDAAEIMSMDVDLADDVDSTMPLVLVDDLPPLNMLNVLAFHWKTMHDSKEPPILRKSSSEIITTYSLGPAMAAQQRRNDRAAREESAVIDVDSSPGSDPDSMDGEGMVFLELPPNGSEAPGHGPRPIDAEVVR